MKTRDATLEDLDFIIEGVLEIRSMEGDTDSRGRDLKQELTQKMREETVKIIEVDGKRAGFIWAVFSKKYFMGAGYDDLRDHYCWVKWSFVHPDFRKQGMGTKLYQALEKECEKKSVKSIFLDVYPVNKNSVKFHDSIGFKKLACVYRKDMEKK
jgi:ribosomal protein S18 acetylase RimI-like enzyme